MNGDFFLTNWIFLGMRWLSENVTGGHIVLTIIISTVIIRGITMFGDIKSRKSSIKMQEIQPDLQKLQRKYKDNPQKLQQAQSKLMKERGVSMWGGCLPMLIMMPLFFCFIAAFRYWGYEQMIKVIIEMYETGSSELFSDFHFLWVHNIWQPDNGLKPVIMAANEFLAIPKLQNLIYFQENPAALDVFQKLGFIIADTKNIPEAAITTYNNLMAPLAAQYEGYNNGWFILPILSGVTTFLTSWLMQKGQPKPQQGQADSAQGVNKTMMYVMPAMSIFFCLTANAAFAVYWIISNLVSAASNYVINKKLLKPADATEVQKQ